MANEPSIFLQDLIEEVAGAMSLPITPIYAKGEKGYNVAFDELAQRDMPTLAYDLEQRGQYDEQVNEKIYFQYQPTLLFLDFSDEYKESAFVAIKAMHLVAIEFMQRLQRLDAYSNVPENERIVSTFTERAFAFDTNLSGVQVNFTIKIDPNIPTPSC